MASEENEKSNENGQMKLKDFLSREKDLISSLGIFVALTIFSKSLLAGEIGNLASLLFLLLTVLIFFELWGQFPKCKGSLRLSLFESYLSIGAILVFLYWLVQLKDISGYLVVVVLSFVVYGPIMTLISNGVIKKFDLFNKLFRTKDEEKNVLRYGFGFVTALVVFFIICIILFIFQGYILDYLL